MDALADWNAGKLKELAREMREEGEPDGIFERGIDGGAAAD